MENAIHNASTILGMYLVGKCRLITPVDTGRLKGSLDFKVIKEGDKTILIIGTNVEYAIFVHEGTRRMRPRRYIKDATFASLGEIKTIFETEFRRAL